jgi:N4-(beta-N-acetylglucosaminyl)-L-asparaginase
MTTIDRRSFLAAGAVAGAGLLGTSGASARLRAQDALPAGAGRGAAALPVVISSGNGLPAVNRAMELLRAGPDPAEAVVGGVALVEDDEKDMSVGKGGLPNEDGVVQLDASVMHGPSHKAGAVAALERIRNPARVALHVLRETDHVLLVGAGALAFAKRMGFQEEDLLTDEAREAWLRWKRNQNRDDDWLDDDQRVAVPPGAAALAGPIPFTHGTIHCAAVDAKGDVGACTSTSGLSWKLAGRVGDSPIVGAGMFVDNAVGAAGATGRGEAVIQSCGAFQLVQHMARGAEPVEACLEVLRWIAARTKLPMLLNDRGEPSFGVTFYALRKDGAFGSACMHKGARFTVHDGREGRTEQSVPLYE